MSTWDGVSKAYLGWGGKKSKYDGVRTEYLEGGERRVSSLD